MNKDLANSIIAINPTSLKELHITTDKYASVKNFIGTPCDWNLPLQYQSEQYQHHQVFP